MAWSHRDALTKTQAHVCQQEMGIAQKVDNIAIIKKNHRAGFKQKKSIIIAIPSPRPVTHQQNSTQKKRENEKYLNVTY
jgi:hypothetical protein